MTATDFTAIPAGFTRVCEEPIIERGVCRADK
jgi:hypothetical protein